MIERYCKKDIYGRETFDHQAYEDDEQMQILSQMSQLGKKEKTRCLSSHSIFSFLKRKKLPTTHIR